jgi:hypothetical protein
MARVMKKGRRKKQGEDRAGSKEIKILESLIKAIN